MNNYFFNACKKTILEYLFIVGLIFYVNQNVNKTRNDQKRAYFISISCFTFIYFLLSE